MDTKTLLLKKDYISKNYLDKTIEMGILLLLIFTPLAIGTVQSWSAAIMEAGAFIIFGVWLLKMALDREIVLIKTPLFIFLIAMIGLTIFQIIPLPARVIELTSPSANKIYRAFLDDGNNVMRTISIYPHATINELLKLLSYAAIFTVIIHHYKTKKQLLSVIHTIIIMGCLIAVFAVAQKATWNGMLFWFYPVGEELYSDATYIWGPYINHNHFAGYMEMAIPVGLGLLLYKALNLRKISGRSRISLTRRLVWLFDSKDIIPVVLLSIAVAVMSAVLFMSLSRGGIIGFVSSMIFFWVMIRTRRSLRKMARPVAVVGIIIIIVIGLAAGSRVEERFGELGKDSKIKRTYIWSDSSRIVKDFPFLGTGLGTFQNIYPVYQTRNPIFLFEHAENDYIEILTDTGFTGFMLILGLAFTWFYSVITAWYTRHKNFPKCIVAGGLSSCVAIAVHSFIDFNMRIPANAMLLTVIAAISYAAVLNRSQKQRPDEFKNIQLK